MKMFVVEEKKSNLWMITAGRSAALFVLTFALLCGSAVASVNPKVQLESYSVSELPAVPGHTVTLFIHLKSLEWDNCAERVTVQVVMSYPLSVSGMDTQYIDLLCFNDSAEKGTVSFSLPVDSLAQSGTYPVTVLTTYEKRYETFSASNTLNLRVGGIPSIIASVVSSNPVDVYPGDTASVTIKFHNNGSGRAESARVKLEAPEGLEVKWAGSEQELGLIAARSSASATFNIEAFKNTMPGTYMLHATLDYASEDKTVSRQDFYFDMPIKEKADFTAEAKIDSPLLSGDDKEVVMALSNTGSQEARKLKVRVRPVFPFSTDGTVRYVESLAPGEKTDLVYVIHTDKEATAGGQISGLLLDFEDPQGNKFTDSLDFALNVKTKSLEDQIMKYWYLGALAVLVVLLVALRKVSSARKKKRERPR